MIPARILLFVSLNLCYLITDMTWHDWQANNTARELQKRVEQLERINIDLKSRLEETSALYEQTTRDLRNKQAELQRITHELEKTREQKDSLARENKKLAGQSTRPPRSTDPSPNHFYTH